MESLPIRRVPAALLMNSTFHQPLEFTLVPLAQSSTEKTDNLFVLSMRYKPEGYFQVFAPVYVSPLLQASLAHGRIKGIHLETLDLEDFVSASLPGKPPYLAVGTLSCDGSRVHDVPREIATLIRRKKIATAALAVGGVALLMLGWVWFGAASLFLSGYTLSKVRRNSFKPFSYLVSRSG